MSVLQPRFWRKLFCLPLILFSFNQAAVAGSEGGAKSCDYYLRFSTRESTQPNFSLNAFYKLPEIWGRPDVQVGTPEFYREIFKRYGLHPRPAADRENIPEDVLPLGLVITKTDFKAGQKGITLSCDSCHSSSLFGHRIVGIGNPFYNGSQLFNDLIKADGGSAKNLNLPYEVTPGQASMVNGADHIGILGLYVRNSNLTINPIKGLELKNGVLINGLKDQLKRTAYLKTPAWINFKTKYESSGRAKDFGGFGYYADGGLTRDSIFGDFVFLVDFSLDLKSVLNNSDLIRVRDEWDRHARTSLLELTPPKYPFPIDVDAARKGFEHYRNRCAACHGTYNIDAWAALHGSTADLSKAQLIQFDQRIVPWDKIRTNEVRLQFTDMIMPQVNAKLGPKTQMTRTGGYAVQPLTAIFARFPYLHTGGVPNLATLLTLPELRPTRWMFIGNPDRPEDYDQMNLGIKIKTLAPNEPVSPFARVYETNEAAGLGVQGHDFGTNLGVREKQELIEFLKTL